MKERDFVGSTKGFCMQNFRFDKKTEKKRITKSLTLQLRDAGWVLRKSGEAYPCILTELRGTRFDTKTALASQPRIGAREEDLAHRNIKVEYTSLCPDSGYRSTAKAQSSERRLLLQRETYPRFSAAGDQPVCCEGIGLGKLVAVGPIDRQLRSKDAGEFEILRLWQSSLGVNKIAVEGSRF